MLANLKVLFQDEIVHRFVLAINRLDIKYFHERFKIKALKLLVLHKHQDSMCDSDDFFEELIAAELVLKNIPVIDLIEKLTHLWTLIDNLAQYLSFDFKIASVSQNL